MSDKKTKGRPKKAQDVSLDVAKDVAAPAIVEAPKETGPIEGLDYIVTQTGEITLKDGSPLPEEHRVDPSHARIAAERKGAR